MKSLAGVQQLYAAQPGQHGGKQQRHGRAAEDTIVLVPLGTVVWQLGPSQAAGGPPGGSGRSRGGGGGGGSKGGEMGGAADGEEWGEGRLRALFRPWVGAVDYRSDSESDREGGEERGGPEVSDQGEREHERVRRLSGAAVGSSGSSSAGQGRRVGEQEGRMQLADLVEDGQEVVVARGGAGGLGNAATHRWRGRPPRRSGSSAARAAEKEAEVASVAAQQRGEPGQLAKVLLELKLLAGGGVHGCGAGPGGVCGGAEAAGRWGRARVSR